MKRDIDYAASAVNKSMVEKFGGKCDLGGLTVVALESVIRLEDGQRRSEGTRSFLMSTIRKAETYDQFWQLAPFCRADAVVQPKQ